jgi:hypothetical protein
MLMKREILSLLMCLGLVCSACVLDIYSCTTIPNGYNSYSNLFVGDTVTFGCTVNNTGGDECTGVVSDVTLGLDEAACDDSGEGVTIAASESAWITVACDMDREGDPLNFVYEVNDDGLVTDHVDSYLRVSAATTSADNLQYVFNIIGENFYTLAGWIALVVLVVIVVFVGGKLPLINKY